MAADALRVTGLAKSFGGNHVLRGIDLSLAPASVTVLMGANGAGKSTLVRILSGHHAPDAGRMQLADTAFAPSDEGDALRRGVVTVHQSIDDGVIPDLDVANNLMLDHLVRAEHGLFVRERRLRAAAAAVATSMGINVDLRARVSDLSVADRQMIAIARAMARDPKVLILDEPTSSLSATESERLFQLIDRLRANGVAILYISHRLSDIRRLADRIVVMRDGAIAGSFGRSPAEIDTAITAMLGHRLTEVTLEPRTGAHTILEVAGLRLASHADPIDLAIRDGEVVAIVGLLGSGKGVLAEILFGQRRPAAGAMRLNGHTYRPGSPRDAIAAGVFLSPKDRGVTAVIPDFDISDNMTLPFLDRFERGGMLDARRQKARTSEMIARLGVVCQSPGDGIATLSGGNQQKVMIARWLLEESQVLILDEPFQGVDMQARRDIGQDIRDSASGRATLVLMAEIDEAIEIADRILVMHDHAIRAEHSGPDIDAAVLLAEIAGGAVAAPGRDHRPAGPGAGAGHGLQAGADARL